MSYQKRLALAMRQSESYTTATKLAQAMGCSPQAVSLVLSGSSKSFGATNHSKASALLHVVPTWLANGEGPMRGITDTPQEGKGSAQRDPVLDDLGVLEPEDADVWRAQIRAAATKVRRAKDRQMAETADFAPAPLKPGKRHKRAAQAIDFEIEAAVPRAKS